MTKPRGRFIVVSACLVLSIGGCSGHEHKSETMGKSQVMGTTSTESSAWIRAAEHRLERVGTDHGELAVRWEFENPMPHTLYVLIRRPLTVPEADPVVLDHSANDPPFAAEVNAESPPVFLELAAGQTLEHRARYHLVLKPDTTTLQIVGRFGYSDVPPDPAWKQHPSWGPMREWQQLVDSETFTATVVAAVE